jgi:hypothetical protein
VIAHVADLRGQPGDTRDDVAERDDRVRPAVQDLGRAFEPERLTELV